MRNSTIPIKIKIQPWLSSSRWLTNKVIWEKCPTLILEARFKISILEGGLVCPENHPNWYNTILVTGEIQVKNPENVQKDSEY